MARRTPRYKAGPKKGQFKPRSSRGGGSRKRKRNPAPKRRRSPRRRATTARSNPPKRRTRRRRNPPKMKPLKALKGGVMDAAAILAGEAGARAIPQLLKLPKEGAIGLGVQAASAVVLGYGADRFISRDVGRMVLAGALAAPMKTFIVAQNFPFVSGALSPTAASSGLNAYKRRGRLSAYARAGRVPATASPSRLSSYVSAGGNGGGDYDFAAYQ